jgi:pseudaminic acid synthase
MKAVNIDKKDTMQRQKPILIEDYEISAQSPPFIIAEMSGNHNQSLERALKIVDAAVESGVHALKLQTYTADTMTLDISEREFFIRDAESLWNGNSLYSLYKQAYTPWEWHKPIIDRCKEHGIIAFSTPFDRSSVDFLEKLEVPAYKIASFENIDLPLIRYVAQTGKPLIISTGMATIAELDEMVRTAREWGCHDLILMNCTSTYPASPENSNLLTISHMKDLFNVEVGLSDHTLGIGVAIASVALGATVLEKHFTLNRLDGGVDSAFSLEPHEMKSLVVESKKAWQSLGQIKYGPTKKEENSLRFRRSIYIVEDMKSGETFSSNNLRCIRPGLGLKPKYYETVIGKKVNRNISKGTPMDWELIG